MKLQALVDFYQTLTPGGVSRFAEFYAADAWFKDPFNEVHDLAGIQKVFRHMFAQVEAPRFVITEQVLGDNGVVLVWEFYYRLRQWRRGQVQIMRGVSHLRFNAEGKVSYHRDYWDTAEELYMKLPVVGGLMRGLRRLMSA